MTNWRELFQIEYIAIGLKIILIKFSDYTLFINQLSEYPPMRSEYYTSQPMREQIADITAINTDVHTVVA